MYDSNIQFMGSQVRNTNDFYYKYLIKNSKNQLIYYKDTVGYAINSLFYNRKVKIVLEISSLYNIITIM